MRVDLFEFDLPPERIAQTPVRPRDAARLLHIGRQGPLGDHHIRDLPRLLQPGDLLVLNDTKVLPTRLLARRGEGQIELTLVEEIDPGRWWAFAKPGRRARDGDTLDLPDAMQATVKGRHEDGRVRLQFAAHGPELRAWLHRHGRMPLPPYIKRPKGGDAGDNALYQPVFARREGAVAAPTASLHLDETMLSTLRDRGINHSFVTLHVGMGTFLPVKVDDTSGHVMHEEWYEVPTETAAAIKAVKARGDRVVAVGTTVLRTLETVATTGSLEAGTGRSDLFITPGFCFQSVDVLLTNFHLPRSTLFMLVSAFSGLERMKAAYAHAIAQEYRFFSYGDACLLERS